MTGWQSTQQSLHIWYYLCTLPVSQKS